MFHGYEKIFKSVQSCRQDFDSGVLRWFYGQIGLSVKAESPFLPGQVRRRTLFYERMGRHESKTRLMNSDDVERALMRISHQIVEKNHGTEGLCLIGIKTRGVPLAYRLQENIRRIENVEPPVGTLDISLYRDDLTDKTQEPTVSETHVPFPVTGKVVILVDDVIYTARTARCALEAIMKLGRPSRVYLAVLIDRGHRELPIRADFVGKNIPTSKTEVIGVLVPPCDGELAVDLYETGNVECERI